MCEESIFGLWQARENLLNRRMFTRRNGVSSLHMQRLELTTMKTQNRPCARICKENWRGVLGSGTAVGASAVCGTVLGEPAVRGTAVRGAADGLAGYFRHP